MSGRPKVFVAGATGFTGRAMATLELPADLTLQVRSQDRASKVFPGDERACVVDVNDVRACADVLAGHDALIQLIGTVRKRFDHENSYKTVDHDTTKSLLEAAAVVEEEHGHAPHVVLVSSVGAGVGLGTYLSWKKKTEQLVRDWAAAYRTRAHTIVRPGIIAGDNGFDERPRMKALGAFLHGMSDTPLHLGAALWRPMPVKTLARLLVEVAIDPPRPSSRRRAAGKDIVDGKALWRKERSSAPLR